MTTFIAILGAGIANYFKSYSIPKARYFFSEEFSDEKMA